MLAVETIARIRREHFVKGEAYWHRRFADRRAASGSLAAKAGKRQASYLSAFEGKPLKIQDVPAIAVTVHAIDTHLGIRPSSHWATSCRQSGERRGMASPAT
jgi:hypothetical protein